MCGIAGMAGPAAQRAIVEAMTHALAHRGPDGSGIHADGDVVLGHTRLSIIDLETGDQPMSSQDGERWLIYNGEIYNFQELRDELLSLGRRFRTRSDSEVILEGYAAWGTDLLPRLDGMFAFALWDAPRRRLLLARDPFGIKPLHYHLQDGTLRFASEVKALLRDPMLHREVDFHALHGFLNVRYVLGDRTLFRGVRRLLPGHGLLFENGTSEIFRYQEPFTAPVSAAPSRVDAGTLAEGIRHHLRRAVEKQLVSDVPLGVYLSGGLDSSALVALMSELTPGPVPTFSLGFGEPTDELADARVVARHFATDHHELVLDPEPLRHFPAVIWASEEPKENILQGYLLARFAAQSLKVVHGGLGGDELFAGYHLHRFLLPASPLHRAVPEPLQRRLLAPLSRALFHAQNATGLRAWDQYRRGLQLLLALGDPRRFYLILRNAWDADAGMFHLLYGPAWRDCSPEPVASYFSDFFGDGHGLEQGLMAEMHTKLVDDFLLNEDRTSMAHGLEVRVPFLDRDLVRFALGIPAPLKMPRHKTKGLFRRAMEPLLPAHTLRKKKRGFHFDALDRFRKDLRPVAERVLTRERVEARGWFNYAFLRQIMDHRPHPRLRWHYFMLWLAVGLEIWARLFLEGDPAHPELELEAYF